MGFYSFMYADTDNEKALKCGRSAYVPQPEGFGEMIYESCYDGYGHFGMRDIYELAASWNREYLSKHPEYVVPSYVKEGSGKISDFPWYPFYADLSLSPDELVEKWKESEGRDSSSMEYRWIGIVLSCEDEDNRALPFPVKICSKPCSYEDVKAASKSDPLQGCY